MLFSRAVCAGSNIIRTSSECNLSYCFFLQILVAVLLFRDVNADVEYGKLIFSYVWFFVCTDAIVFVEQIILLKPTSLLRLYIKVRYALTCPTTLMTSLGSGFSISVYL